MRDPDKPIVPKEPVSPRLTVSEEDTMICERCGSPRVYRMHAVWRCADCGYKTDCCGW